MKTPRRSSLLLFSCFFGLVSCQKQTEDPLRQPAFFYYAFQEKIPLFVVENKAVVRYTSAVDRPTTEATIRQIVSDVLVQWLDDRTAKITVKSGSAIRIFGEQLSKRNDVYTVNPVYALKTGLEVGVTDEILLNFLNQIPESQREALHRKHKTEVLKTTSGYQLARVPKGANALEIANRIQESGLVEYAHPNFLVETERFK